MHLTPIWYSNVSACNFFSEEGRYFLDIYNTINSIYPSYYRDYSSFNFLLSWRNQFLKLTVKSNFAILNFRTQFRSTHLQSL